MIISQEFSNYDDNHVLNVIQLSNQQPYVEDQHIEYSNFDETSYYEKPHLLTYLFEQNKN